MRTSRLSQQHKVPGACLSPINHVEDVSLALGLPSLAGRYSPEAADNEKNFQGSMAKDEFLWPTLYSHNK